MDKITRRENMKKYTVLTAAAAAAFMVHREYMHGLDYICNLSLCRGSKAFLFNCNNITTELKAYENIRGEFPKIKKWYKKVRPERMYILGSSKRPLYLRMIKQPVKSQKWVIAAHGYGCTGRSMLFCAKKFYENGFNVIIPDLPCHGRSYGRYIGMGQYEYKDILIIADKIKALYADAKILLYGISMGAATVLTAAGTRPENIDCVVSDCSFSDARSVLKFQLGNIFHVPTFPLINDLDRVYRKKTGFSLKNADIKKSAAGSVPPTLFIHGGADNIVPTSNVYKLYNAASCPKDLLIVKGAGHGVSAYTDIDTYWKKVFDFTQEHMFNTRKPV